MTIAVYVFLSSSVLSLSLSLRPPRSLAWKKLRVLTQRRQTFDNMWKMLRRCVCVDLHVFNVDLQMKHSEPAYLSNFLLYLRCDTLCNRSRGKYLEPQKCRDWKFAMRGKQPKHIAPPLELYPFEWSRCNLWCSFPSSLNSGRNGPHRTEQDRKRPGPLGRWVLLPWLPQTATMSSSVDAVDTAQGVSSQHVEFSLGRVPANKLLPQLERNMEKHGKPR